MCRSCGLLLRRPSNTWRQRRRYVMSARHHQEAAPQVGPEHWMPAPEVIELPRAQATQHPEAPVAQLPYFHPAEVEDQDLEKICWSCAGQPPAPLACLFHATQ